MNKSAFATLLALCLAACGDQSVSQVQGGTADNGPPLAGAPIGGAFTLIDQDGKTVTDRDLLGKYRIMYFGYTFCPDICPVDVQSLMKGFRLFEKQHPALAAKVQPIFVTVDPERDTPAVLKSYVAAFHPRLMGLTGTPDQIAKVANEYLVSYQKVKDAGDAEYRVNHGRTPYLMSPDGKPIALLPVDDTNTPADEGNPQAVADELARWVK